MRKSPDSTSTIERCPHDREKPYAMISRALIRDKSISPKCRMILIYLVSRREENCEVRADQLRKIFKGQIGKELVYKLINEAIKAGYVRREKYTENNLIRFHSYLTLKSEDKAVIE